MAKTLWLTGLPGSGKTTLARLVRDELASSGEPTHVLDGDDMRRGLCSDLGFSRQDRAENVRRVSEVARVLNDAGVTAVVACVSPHADARARARSTVVPHDFLEAWVSTPLSVCRARDPKGLYARAERGEVHKLTGLTAPYEEPESPDVVVDGSRDPGVAVAALLAAVRSP